ncbi:MAG: hypothetical protein V1800_05820 [Candidatus Latescibacterota bacterium]
MLYKLMLWGAVLYFAVRAIRSILAARGGVLNDKRSKERPSEKDEFEDAQDAEFEDIKGAR